MPIYASNLGFVPLEPIKPEVVPSVPQVPEKSIQEQSSQVQVLSQTDIPTAQFDWMGSGLTNPLDCKYNLPLNFFK